MDVLLSHTHSIVCTVSYFDPKNYILMPNFYVNQHFSADATMCRNSNFVPFLSKKTFSKVEFFSKIAEIFSAAKIGSAFSMFPILVTNL
jgi:hypothetical protein